RRMPHDLGACTHVEDGRGDGMAAISSTPLDPVGERPAAPNVRPLLPREIASCHSGGRRRATGDAGLAWGISPGATDCHTSHPICWPAGSPAVARAKYSVQTILDRGRIFMPTASPFDDPL